MAFLTPQCIRLFGFYSLCPNQEKRLASVQEAQYLRRLAPGKLAFRDLGARTPKTGYMDLWVGINRLGYLGLRYLPVSCGDTMAT